MSEMKKNAKFDSPPPFSSADMVTFFAPTNQAVLKWKQQYPHIAANHDALARLCKAWLVPDVIMSSAIADEKVAQTLNGAKLRFNIYTTAATAAIKVHCISQQWLLYIPGGPIKTEHVGSVDFSGLCSDQVIFFHLVG